MTDQKSITRRNFLKVGALASVSLPTITAIGKIGGKDLVESADAYGGFTVRTHERNDPPYKVDNSIYKRFDAKDAIFSRFVWDAPFADKIANTENVFKKNDPGYSHLDSAINDGAVFCATYDGTNSPMQGLHAGLLAFDSPFMSVPTKPSFEGRWDHSVLSSEEVAAAVKKAGLFYGASLVGIAPLLDPRWIFSGYYDMLQGKEGPIVFTEVEKVELPEGQVPPQEAGEIIKSELEKWEGKKIKELLVDIMTNTDPSLLPSNAPPVGMIKVLPAKEFKKRLSMFTAMPTPMLRIMAEKLGLDFVIANIDPGESARPRYLEDGSLAIPETMKTVIVLAFEMDYDGIQEAPTTLGDVATMDGYSKMAITAGSLSVFLRSLGYNAIPCGNNTGLSVPLAIDAGLGELGRNGILITPKYGPRVRLAKVITDLPMSYDQPISFGVKEFCDVCKKCAVHCPTQAISHGTQTTKPTTISTNPGVVKWPVQAEECYVGWHANGSGCGMCIKVCPFNKQERWLHDATRILIGAKSGSLDKLLVKLDDASGYGTPEPKIDFWKNDNYIHIKG